jgi:Protein of unknown function, DUF481
MRKFFPVLALSIVIASTVVGQDALKIDTIRFDVHLSSTAILSGGNLERTVSQNRLWGSVGNSRLQFVTENSYRYGKNFTRVVENDMLTRNYIRFFPDNKLYGFVLATYEDNFRRSIENRWQVGGGGAYNFYKRNRDFLKTSIAIAHEQADYKYNTFNLSEYNGNFNVKETRGIFRVGGLHTIANSHLSVRHDTWFMVGFNNTQNYRWHSLIGLQVAIYKGPALKTDFDYTYENLTISNNNPFGFPSSTNDWILSFGLSYDVSNKRRE